MSVIINVASGKGGAGKTLLTAVLAEALGSAGRKVLVADLDVFVRGLTSLLFFRRADRITVGGLTVSDFLRDKARGSGGEKQAAIVQCRSFDVLPSVSSVDEILNFRDVMPDDPEEAKNILSEMLSRIPGGYDYIFLDSRAGYDEFIAAAHEISDFTLCVEEADRISQLTSKNLIGQLSRDDAKTPVAYVRNKVRRLKFPASMPSGEHTPGQTKQDAGQTGVAQAFYIGDIPFDTDVMESFGTERFWTEIGRSVYREALARAWNIMAETFSLPDKLASGKRVNPIGWNGLEQSLSMLSTTGRILFVYGILLALLGLLLTAGGGNIMIGNLTASAGNGINLPLWGIGAGLCGLALMAGAVISGGKK